MQPWFLMYLLVVLPVWFMSFTVNELMNLMYQFSAISEPTYQLLNLYSRVPTIPNFSSFMAVRKAWYFYYKQIFLRMPMNETRQENNTWYKKNRIMHWNINHYNYIIKPQKKAKNLRARNPLVSKCWDLFSPRMTDSLSILPLKAINHPDWSFCFDTVF